MDRNKNNDSKIDFNKNDDVIKRSTSIVINLSNIVKQDLEVYEKKCIDKLKRARWYAVRCVGGKEKKIMEELCTSIINEEDESFLQIFIPFKEKKIRTRAKRTIKRMTNEISGHIFIKMILNENARNIVRQTPNIIEFIGEIKGDRRTMPLPITEREINTMINKYVGKQHKETKIEIDFKVGDFVEVIDGPFEGYRVKVQSISSDAIQAEIEMLGRIVDSTIPLNSVKSIS